MRKQDRRGILAGGNWIVDYVKLIDIYPGENALANILSQGSSNGGAPYSVLKALYKMGVDFPLEGAGVIGNDENGVGILRDCQHMNIDTSQIKVLAGIETSYTDVMTVATTGKRTFFHCRGSNSHLDTVDFDFSSSSARIFHLGYLLLLDKLDTLDEGGISGASKVLKRASENGMITSADIVSEQSDRYKSVVPSALPYIDVLFLNELEAGKLTGIDMVGEANTTDASQVCKAANAILNMGVRQWVIVHFTEGAIAMGRDGSTVFQPSIKVPQEMVKGAVGAGDAFAAGVLGGLHEGWSMADSLRSGVSVAAASLFHPSASEGIEIWYKCLALGNELGFRDHKMSENLQK